MDYTNNPEVNAQPGTYNYEFLAQLYGTVPGYVSPEPEGSQTQSAAGGGNRRRRNTMAAPLQGPEDENDSIPDWVMARWRELDEELDNHSHGSERRAGWRMLEESDRGESHEIDIGQGFRIRVHKLLVPSD